MANNRKNLLQNLQPIVYDKATPSPVGVWFKDVKPYSHEIIVELEYQLHNGTKEKHGKVGTLSFIFRQEEFLPVIKKYLLLREENFFAVIGGGEGPLVKLSKARDKAFVAMHKKLVSPEFKDAANSSERFARIERYMQADPDELLRRFAKLEATMAVVSREERFQEDDDKKKILQASRGWQPAPPEPTKEERRQIIFND